MSKKPKTEAEQLKIAQEYERKAKEIRRNIEKEKEERRQKLSDKFMKIIEDIVGREITEIDSEKFRVYANGIGKQYIVKALNAAVLTAQGAPMVSDSSRQNEAEKLSSTEDNLSAE